MAIWGSYDGVILARDDTPLRYIELLSLSGVILNAFLFFPACVSHFFSLYFAGPQIRYINYMQH